MNWLLTLFALSNYACGQKVTIRDFCSDETCQTWHTPYDNMPAGLVGYDPVLADPLDFKKDPGMYIPYSRQHKQVAVSDTPCY